MSAGVLETTAGPRLEDIRIEPGGHGSRAEGVCLAELAAWMAGEEHTPHPSGVMPPLRDYASFANDHLDDGPRQLLREVARDLAGSGCPCEQDVMNTLIREALLHGVCPGLRRNGMPIQALNLEIALDAERNPAFPGDPLPRLWGERVIRETRLVEQQVRAMSQDEAMLEMTRQAHSAAVSAWGTEPSAPYRACWAAHRAVARAFPDHGGMAREIIRQVRAAMAASRCGRNR